MNSHFRELIEGFCKLSGLDDPGRILDGGAIVVNEVVFSLIHSDKVNPGLLFIYCDFGDVPRGREAEAYRALLEANLFLYTGEGPSFTLSHETGRVLFVDRYTLQGGTSEKLRDILVNLAAKAMEWRTHHFLQNKAPAPKTTSPASRLPGMRPNK